MSKLEDWKLIFVNQVIPAEFIVWHETEVAKAKIAERFNAYEAIYHIHMAHDWSPMHADTKDWLSAYLKETHHMKARLEAEVESKDIDWDEQIKLERQGRAESNG